MFVCFCVHVCNWLFDGVQDISGVFYFLWAWPVKLSGQLLNWVATLHMRLKWLQHLHCLFCFFISFGGVTHAGYLSLRADDSSSK